ncbi:MAG: RNA polymerase sigma factor, partial [Clostridia bacterium]|nr:RNA polymerase sigma factor [Clostridia bacterium]
MEKNELNQKIAEVSKSVLSYCLARTSNTQDAEDLAQEILLKIMTSAQNLRNDEAFYGFMWAVAGNVFKDWLRKKSRHRNAELTEIDATENFDFEKLDNESDIFLLRRELALLNEKHRKATVLYYINNKSCAEIAQILSVSENMVKYLLFKSRKILKEGMNMERNYGEQSYNPKGLEIQFLGNGNNRYWQLGRRIVPQNILFACY